MKHQRNIIENLNKQFEFSTLAIHAYTFFLAAKG